VRGQQLVASLRANTNSTGCASSRKRRGGRRRETILAVHIPERPGEEARRLRHVGARNITEFNYRIADPRDAHVFVGVEVNSGESPPENVTRSSRARAAHDRPVGRRRPS